MKLPSVALILIALPGAAQACATTDFGRQAIGEKAAAAACGSKPSCEIEDAGVTYVIQDGLVREKRTALSRLSGFGALSGPIDEAFAHAASRAACVPFEFASDEGWDYVKTAEAPDPKTRYPFNLMIHRDDKGVLTLSRTSLPEI